MKIKYLMVCLFSASLVACGGSSNGGSAGGAGNSSNSPASIQSSVSSSATSLSSVVSTSASSIALSSSVASDSSSSSESSLGSSDVSSILSSSSVGSSSSVAAVASLPLLENFDQVVDAAGFFSSAYKSLAGSNQAFYYSLSGAPTFHEGRLRLAGARFSLAHAQPGIKTTNTDTQTLGEFDLTQPYRISFCVLNWEVTGANKSIQLYVDNNDASAGSSIHLAASRLLSAAVDTLVRGERVVVNASLGTATSFIQLRTESGAVVVLDDLWIGYQSDTSTEPGAQTCADSLGASSSSSNSSSSSSSAANNDAPLLAQTNNPVYTELNNYKSWLSGSGDTAAKLVADKALADRMITWQMPHGGFYKFGVSKYASAWNGSAARSEWTGAGGVELGTIDNDGTVSELLFLADVYKRSGDTKYRTAARAALDFLLTMQSTTGGWPQVYPARTGTTYSNYITFNDNAMARVLILLDQANKAAAPFDMDVFSQTQLDQIDTALNKAVDYILNAQILQGGVRTVWCAQHDPFTYAARGARSYELPSKSGKESVLVTAFLMTRPQTPAVEASVKAALAWYRSGSVKVANTAYIKRASNNSDDTYNPIQAQNGSTIWYRFYDLEANTGFFSGRLPSDNPPGTGKQYDIMAIEAERRYGYEWGGNYGTALLNYAASVGY